MPPSSRKTALFIEAEKLRIAEQFEKAIPLYKAILSDDPGDTEVRRTLAGLYLIAGSRQLGLSEYMLLVAHHIEAGDREKAQHLLTRVRNLDKEGRFRMKLDALAAKIVQAQSNAPPPPPEAPVAFSIDGHALPAKQGAPAPPAPQAVAPPPATPKAAAPTPPAPAKIVAPPAPAPAKAVTPKAPPPPTPAMPDLDAEVTDDDLAEAEAEVEQEARDMSKSSATLSNVLFKALPPEVLNKVIRACEKVSFSRGQTIFEEGSSSRSLFIVGHGIVEVRAERSDGGKSVGVAKLGPGELFGEMAFLTGDRREAAVVADSDSLCFRLSQADAEQLMEEHQEFKKVALDLYKQRVVGLFIATSKVLGALPPEAREALLSEFELQDVKEGQVVIQEGGQGDDLYFVKKGEVRVITKGPKETVELARMGKHHLFGEISFLTKGPRTASVIATKPGQLLRIRGDRLRVMTHQYPKLKDALKEVQLKHAKEAAEKLLGKR